MKLPLAFAYFLLGGSSTAGASLTSIGNYVSDNQEQDLVTSAKKKPLAGDSSITRHLQMGSCGPALETGFYNGAELCSGPVVGSSCSSGIFLNGIGSSETTPFNNNYDCPSVETADSSSFSIERIIVSDVDGCILGAGRRARVEVDVITPGTVGNIFIYATSSQDGAPLTWTLIGQASTSELQDTFTVEYDIISVNPITSTFEAVRAVFGDQPPSLICPAPSTNLDVDDIGFTLVPSP